MTVLKTDSAGIVFTDFQQLKKKIKLNKKLSAAMGRIY